MSNNNKIKLQNIHIIYYSVFIKISISKHEKSPQHYVLYIINYMKFVKKYLYIFRKKIVMIILIIWLSLSTIFIYMDIRVRSNNVTNAKIPPDIL